MKSYAITSPTGEYMGLSHYMTGKSIYADGERRPRVSAYELKRLASEARYARRMVARIEGQEEPK